LDTRSVGYTAAVECLKEFPLGFTASLRNLSSMDIDLVDFFAHHPDIKQLGFSPGECWGYRLPPGAVLDPRLLPNLTAFETSRFDGMDLFISNRPVTHVVFSFSAQVPHGRDAITKLSLSTKQLKAVKLVCQGYTPKLFASLHSVAPTLEHISLPTYEVRRAAFEKMEL
jgi:hypothetical protein